MNIKIKHTLTWLFIVISAHLSVAVLYSQEDQPKPSLQVAMDDFSKGDYEKAFSEFITLLQVYSRDPLYKYYSGVCLVKMNRHPENASAYLRDALSGSLDIKDIPNDVWFYLGRSQQMAGKYPDAIKSYNNFEVKVGKKIAKEFKLSGYIQECNEGRGRIKDPEFREIEFISKTNTVGDDAGQKATGTKAGKQSVTKPVPRKEELPREYDKVLSQAMDYQVRADSLNTLVLEYKKELEELPALQQKAAKSRISEMETLAAEYQKLADEKFGNTGTKPPARKEDVAESVLAEADLREEIYSLFNIETDPVRLRDQKIELDPEIPAGLIYRIQMGVFSKPLDPGFFKGMTPLTGFRISGTGSIRYFAGMFRRMEDASRSLVTVKQMGFKDSFITAVLDGKAVSIDRASLMENEWGKKPLIVIAPARKAVDTEASTLVFRVEVTRSVKPVGDETTEAYRKITGNRGFEIITAEDGKFVYLIGKFITFESASEYADILKRNGYRDAKVSAYLGRREIPVEKAKQLFEK